MSNINDLPDMPTPTGYATHDEYFAMQFVQGGRTVYSIDLSIPQIVNIIPRPDPTKHLEGNRRINPPRGKAFARYLRECTTFVCPSLLLRAPQGEFAFTSKGGVPGGSRFGVLAIRRLARQSVEIIDGQHRILGFHVLWENLATDLQNARQHSAEADRDGDKALRKNWHRQVDKFLGEQNRFDTERVRIDIVIVDDPVDYKQVFFDIADNQKGISGAVKARFDTTKVAHRALDDVFRHPLLQGRVDHQSDRVAKNSKYFIGAKHVADIIRAVQVGSGGRISRRQENELQDETVIREAERFLDLAVEAFPLLKDLQDEVIVPTELRRVSVLGSATMLRVLAGVHQVLTSGKNGHDVWKRNEVRAFFNQLDPHLKAPIDRTSLLMSTGSFKEDGNAPSAGQGDVKKLETEIVNWARDNQFQN